MECKHVFPEHTYDTAVPIDWVIQRLNPVLVKHKLKEPGLPHIVWSYGPDDGLCGRPMGVCDYGRAVVGLL